MNNPNPIEAGADFAFSFTFADRLAKALRVASVSVEEMADALGVSRTTISNYTSGRTTPSRLQVREWAARTGAPVTWLEAGTHETPAATRGRTGVSTTLPGLDSNQEPAG